MFPDLNAQPGLFFVAATLVPLLSFVLIFLASGMWALLRPYRHRKDCEFLYNLFGGDKPGRGAAYVALAGIAGAFALSLTGFCLFLRDAHEIEPQKHHLEHEIADLKNAAAKADAQAHKTTVAAEKRVLQGEIKAKLHEVEGLEGEFGRLDHKYSGRYDWLRLLPNKSNSIAKREGINDPEHGTVLQVGFRIDHLNALMFVMVTFIASLIHLFSMSYMSEELDESVSDHHVHAYDTEDGHYHRRGRFGRFFLFLSLFCFSMLNLILADNLFQVFVSWELVGICSYLLVGFYFERQSASNAANKAFITNRVGDAGFLIGLFIIWSYVGSFNFEDIFKQVRSPEGDRSGAGRLVTGAVKENGAFEPATSQGPGSQLLLFPRLDSEAEHGAAKHEIHVKASPHADEYSVMPYWLLVVAGLGIFLGCVGKSAQFPLQVWLPDAMEGPTPVSALIHAATMVAAGVYLVGRCYPLFAPETLLVIAYTGAITLFVAATIAVVMTDIKKVLAYSTVSQLGFMMLALGVGGWTAGLFHLITHACFKALLFLGSGSVIYGCHHEQEMTKMGGLWSKMRITAFTMLMGVLAISGIPLFSGWYSKDAVLGAAFGFVMHNHAHYLLFILPLVTAGITTFYMFRMWFMTFLGKPRDHHVYDHAHESPVAMTVPLILLAILSVCVAWGNPIWDPEKSWLEEQLHHAQPVSVMADFGSLPEAGEDAAALGVHVKPDADNQRLLSQEWGPMVGLVTLGVVAVGLLFASLTYWFPVLDAAETKKQFPQVHSFLMHKWYFDELYSVLLVRPALVVGHWFRIFDQTVIDGAIHGVARNTRRIAEVDGNFDKRIIDGLANLVAAVFGGIGGWLRNVQTGYLRGYVLFLALAAVSIVVLLSYMG